MANIADILAEARDNVTCLTITEAQALLGKPAVRFVDVRETGELEAGSIPGAISMPRSNLEWLLVPAEGPLPFAPDERLVFLCGSGGRSLLSAKRALELGYTDVASLDGGFRGWTAAGAPVAPL